MSVEEKSGLAGNVSENDVRNNVKDENGILWKKVRCFFCQAHCPLYVGTDENGVIVEVKALNRQAEVCERRGEGGEKFIRVHYHPKRVNHVLKRVGRRGEDKWEEISYDQALSEVAQKLADLKEKYGPETLVVAEGTYRSDHLWARSRFTNLFGNPGNIIDPGTICWCWTYTLNMSMVGWPIEQTVPPSAPMANTQIFWGKRITEAGTPRGFMWQVMRSSVDRPSNPGKFICIDPQATVEACESDVYLPINPGTDLYMQLTWCNYIIQNELYDKDFLSYWTNAPFLMNKRTRKLVRASEIDGSYENGDFIAVNEVDGSIVHWCSDENKWYESCEVKPVLSGAFEVTLSDGSVIECITAFDAIAERLSGYTLNECSRICGVRAQRIKDAVHLFATNGPASIGWGIGGGEQAGANATYTGVAKTWLRILTGNIDNPGGEAIGDPGFLEPDGSKKFPVRDSELELSEFVSQEAREKFLGNDIYKVMSWKGFDPIDKCYRKMWDIPRPMMHQLLVTPPLVWDAILEEKPYPVKAMIAWSSNILAWAPNTKRVYEALKALDLLVVVDYWKTPTAALADYIFPAADSLERPMATTCEDAFDFIEVGDRGAQPVGDRKTDYEFFRGLGIRLGQEEYWPWEEYEDVVAHRVERAGFTYEEACEKMIVGNSKLDFYKYGKTLPNGQIRGFATMSRKAEIYPTLLEDLGYDPLPTYREPAETPFGNPELAKEYPLRLTTGGRFVPMFHSEFRVPGYGMRSMWPWPTCQINVTDARDLGIRDGDWVWIETKRGRIRQKAKLEFSLKQGVVSIQPSWWYPELPAEEPWSQGIFESNANVLTNDSYEVIDEMSGQWVARGMLCKVYPCIDPADRSDTEAPASDFLGASKRSFFENEYKHLSFAEAKKL